MSLLDCICCPEHDYRTAIISDDLIISSVETYGCMIGRACILACYLRRKFNEISGQSEGARLVAILSESCSEALSAIVGILAVPAAFMPLNTGRDEVVREMGERVRQHGVQLILVHHSCAEDFLSAEWSDGYITVDATTLEFGFLCFIFRRTTLHLPPSYTSSPSFQPSLICSPRERCRYCSSLNLPSLPTCTFLRDSIISYHSEVQLAQCTVCSQPSTKNTSDDSTKHSINSNTTKNSRFPAVSPTAVAYVVHTSGTTGNPKSVRVPHCCLVPNILDLTRRFSLSPNDTVFNAAPLTFDPSIVEMFLSLHNGAILLTVSSRVKRSPRQLADVLLRRSPATVLQITPSLFRCLPEGDVRDRLLGDRSSVRVLALGGEQFPRLKFLSHLKSPSNATLIFNIYGTTEVSSWATCHAVTETHLQKARREGEGEGEGEREGDGEGEGGEREVPVGGPMLGTRLEVRDSAGKTVAEGYGEIFIGGEYRVCLVGDETRPAQLRGTGDRGWVNGEGDVFFVGRLDRQIKRWGHRLSLDLVEQIVVSQETVRGCAAAVVSDAKTLHKLFPAAKMKAGCQRLVAFAVPQTSPGAVLQSREWRERVMAGLAQRLSGHLVPDVIVPVHHLPFNRHGKVDMQRLLQLQEDSSLYLTPLPLTPTTPSLPSLQTNTSTCPQAVEDELLSLLTHLTPLPEWPENLTLLEVGATSFDLVRIADALEEKFREISSLSSLTDVLLTRTYRGVAKFLWEEIRIPTAGGEVGERWGEVDKEEPARKRPKRESSESFPPRESALSSHGGCIRAWRRGKVFLNGEPALATVTGASGHTEEKAAVLEMVVKWSYDTGRCVDASPLVVVVDHLQPTVFIGSHSSLFVALCVLSGRCLWKVQLSDRIESSACLTADGAHVVVGCYDGHMYCMRADNGRVKWSLQLSGEPVKSSPCVDVSTGLVWVGSHDHHLYAIDGESGGVVHRVFLGGGSCFSSPCLDTHRGLVYVATLRGILTAVDKDSGSRVWKYGDGGKPIFSSPCLLPGGELAVGSVDGNVYIVRSSGTMVRGLKTESSVFSSPSAAVLCDGAEEMLTLEEEQEEEEIEIVGEGGREAKVEDRRQKSSVRLFCGSHDKCVYCWDGRKGQRLWKTTLDSAVYATPSPCNILHTNTSESAAPLTGETSTSTPSPNCTEENIGEVLSCVCVSTSSGVVYLLDLHTGRIHTSLSLGGQIFSSPAVVDNHILVGCRDDCVYCVKCLFH